MESSSAPGSHRADHLCAVARSVADRCPPELGHEIALTGSVGAGLADDHSDIELLFLVDSVPAQQRVMAWLASLGATDLLAGPDSSGVWAWCRLDDIELDPFWGRVGEAEAEVAAILRGEVVAHERLAFAHALTHSRVLRTTGVLGALAERLQVYPEHLQRRLIDEAVRGCEIPAAHLGPAVRNDRLAVEGTLLWHAQRVLRIVFALNRRWEPPRWKWSSHYAETLEVAPPRLSERIRAALVEPDSLAAVRAMLELLRDTLELVPASIDVRAARRGIEARLAAVTVRHQSTPAEA